MHTRIEDKRRWLVAFACCWCNCMLYGIARLSGLLLVYLVKNYGISRAHASIPFSISSAFRNFTGPFIGYLAHRTGVRTACIIGAVIASVGVSLCYFDVNVVKISIFYGAFFGVGYGIVTTLLPQVINENFEVYRSVASGIAYSGAFIGSTIFPLFINMLMMEYGFSGSLLILSGIVLNSLIGIMFFTTPASESLNSTMEDIEWIDCDLSTQKSNIPSCISIASGPFQNESINKTSKPIPVEPSIMGTNKRNKTFNSNITQLALSAKDLTPSKYLHGNESRHLHLKQLPATRKPSMDINILPMKIAYDSTAKQLDSVPQNKKVNSIWSVIKPFLLVRKYTYNLSGEHGICLPSMDGNYCQQVPHYTHTHQQRSNRYRHAESRRQRLQNRRESWYTAGSYPVMSRKLSMFQLDHLKEDKSKEQTSRLNTILQILKIFRSPIFCVVCVTSSLYSFIVGILLNIIPDFAKDIGTPASSIHIAVMVLSVSDLTGSLTVGWITDREFMSRRFFVVACYTGMAATLFAIANCSTFNQLLLLIAVFGICESGVLINSPLLLVESIEFEKQVIAVASRDLLSGPIVLLIPLILSYFRDRLGSYNSLFYLLASTSLFCSVLWTLVPYLSTKRVSVNQNDI